jgi:hypothetical protein
VGLDQRVMSGFSHSPALICGNRGSSRELAFSWTILRPAGSDPASGMTLGKVECCLSSLGGCRVATSILGQKGLGSTMLAGSTHVQAKRRAHGAIDRRGGNDPSEREVSAGE